MGSTSDITRNENLEKILKTLKDKYQVSIVMRTEPLKECLNLLKMLQRGFAVIVQEQEAQHICWDGSILINLPVIGVPIESKKLRGLDALISHDACQGMSSSNYALLMDR